MDNDSDNEASRDPGMCQPVHYTEQDFEGHRAHTVFVGVHMPGGRRHSHRRHRHHHKDDGEKPTEFDRPITPPAQRVQFILGEDIDDGTHESHPLFSEMEELVRDGDELEWKETARWVKFEEDVEEGGNRWSKPHVATLSLHSLFELRSLLTNGTVMLDMDATSLDEISDLVCDNMVNAGTLQIDSREKVRDALMRRHRHQHERGDVHRKKDHNMSRLPIIRSLADIGRNQSSSKNFQQQPQPTKSATLDSLHANVTSSLSTRNLNSDDNNAIIIKSPSIQTALLSAFKKDQRGCYLAVPTTTDDIAIINPSDNNTEEVAVGVTTCYHAGASQAMHHQKVVSTTTNFAKVEEHHNLSLPGFSSNSMLSSSSNNQLKPTTGDTNSGNGKHLSVPGRNSFLNVSSGEDMVKSPSSISMQRNTSGSELHQQNGGCDPHKVNTHFMKKIPHGAEASNILVGEVDFLDKTMSAFIRLNDATIMGDLTEVPVPTRFIFILLGPSGSNASYHEIGRAMATLMSDEIFHEVAYRARKRDHLLAGIDEFLDAVTVLPPGEWDPTIRIEPPAAIPSQDLRKRPPEKPTKKEDIDEDEEEEKLRQESGLSRSGRIFGGLINDLKRKKPWYVSDFTDALNSQCIASWIFLYFACLSPIITFGGLLAVATGKNMAAMESLVSGFVCGLGYGLFSGQPLTILGSTGPVLVFEAIVYKMCTVLEWDYMSFRFWIGTWIVIILLILVAVDASALVCYITRFTEENFACLIAFIFIYKAIENVLLIVKKFPVNPPEIYDCVCTPPAFNITSPLIEWAKYDKGKCLTLGGLPMGPDCVKPEYIPNVFLMSSILFLGTFTISVILKDFKNALFFPSKVRQFISDFSVIIAIFSMSILDYLCGIATPKLEVPSEFKPTLEDRGWIISPFKNPVYTWIIAIIPALLGTILVFMDQQITAVIVNRKENKLKKGCGYHLDLFVLAILIQVCTVMGLPWFVAATVLSINHVNSLKLESECAAPGEKPQFLGVREQRVTHVLIFLMIGCSVLLTPLLSHIPMPVLFGVFLYMGVASLKGLQFFDRILIMFMPVKYQPDFMFLRQVPLKRVHIFTIIQLACLIILWVIKSFEYISITFPLMLVVMIGIRKSLEIFFTRRELKILDDIMPDIIKRQQHSEDMHCLGDNGGGEDPPPAYPGDLNASAKHCPSSTASINITEEFNKTTIWKQVNEGNGKNNSLTTNALTKSDSNKRKKHASDKKLKHLKKENGPRVAGGDKRLSTMTEEEEVLSISQSASADEHARLSIQNLSQV